MASARTKAGLTLAVVAATVAGWWFVARGARPATRPSAADAHFVGSEACGGCHANATAAWKPSQHARAMQHASAQTVLGNFDDATFTQAGVESRFFVRDGKFMVHTDGPDGALADFEVKYTFGVEPLQQYLVQFPDGRLQALSLAWDSRAKAAGGQRWFHLYPDEKIDHLDELHWTKRAQNWNFMCADCHSTDVRKNYDEKANTFATTWKEISVGCEACHGPGSAHLDWAKAPDTDATRGLTVSLSERATASWAIDGATGTAKRSRPRERDTELEVCAPCHARRSQISEGFRAGQPFQDFYRPAVLGQGLYWPDGQQRDEVYNYGSFLQSRMFHSGVTCGDCHEPHAGKVRAAGNALCATCHLASKYDTQAHHHHPGAGAGTRCVECHMPTTTYMVVDPRHDHSFRVPRTDLSVSQRTPNPCSGCHADHDAAWAATQAERWYGHPSKGFQRYAEAFGAAEQGAAQSASLLASVAADRTHPAIARAGALEAVEQFPSRAAVDAASAGLRDADPLVRRASVGALVMLPPDQRLPLVAPLLDDPVRTVRLEAAEVLSDAMGAASPTQKAAFERAAAQFVQAQRFNADRPEARAALGNFFARQGRLDEAQAHLQSAVGLDPTFVPGYVNLADLWRTQGRDADAERTLRQGLVHAPDAPALHHALGLALVRRGRGTDALPELYQAAKLAPADARFAYVYAISLHSMNRPDDALAELDRALGLHPGQRELLIAAATIRRDRGDLEGARSYVQRLSAQYPADPDVAQLVKELGAAP